MTYVFLRHVNDPHFTIPRAAEILDQLWETFTRKSSLFPWPFATPPTPPTQRENG